MDSPLQVIVCWASISSIYTHTDFLQQTRHTYSSDIHTPSLSSRNANKTTQFSGLHGQRQAALPRVHLDPVAKPTSPGTFSPRIHITSEAMSTSRPSFRTRYNVYPLCSLSLGIRRQHACAWRVTVSNKLGQQQDPRWNLRLESFSGWIRWADSP